LKSSKRIHNETLKSLLQSPMSFFDETPQGRILNRFSKDVDVLDSTIPENLRSLINCFSVIVR
jgi:ABC-type multidrug transport system fused ATPase/permease subunit